MPVSRTIALTSLAMLAFACNSILCRIALQQTKIDAASFTFVRLLAGAVVLWLVVAVRQGWRVQAGNWLSAVALFVYAAGFSFAYISLPTATGALLLFCAVQATMIGYGLVRGERLRRWQWLGLLLAVGGLVVLLLPGIAAPPVSGALLMCSAGVAWGIYSLRGKGVGNPLAVTAGNFWRAVPLAVGLSLILFRQCSLDSTGIWCAVASGAIASGIGYSIWYSALPHLQAIPAAIVQLSVPVIAAAGGVLFLHEPISLRLAAASVAILGGIALVIVDRQSANVARPADNDAAANQ